MTADLEKINGYSIALAEKLCNDVFAGKEKITGDEIRNLLPVKQINIFTLKGLFSRWREETTRLRSPYFDYESEDVQAAINNLMNALSNNISVSREFLRPLLIKAIEDTLILATNPVQVLEREWRPGEEISIASIEEKEKFYKINHHYLSELKNIIRSSGRTTIVKEQAIDMLRNTNISPEENTVVFEQLSELLQIEVNSIRLSPSLEQPATEFPTTRPETQHVAPEPPSFQDIPQPAEPVQEQPASADEPVPLYRRFAGNKEPEEPARPKMPIKDLTSSISLSEKFLFINSLFEGNSAEYHAAIEKIEKSPDLDAARNALHQNYAVKYNWNYEEKEMQEFMELVERRFL